MCVCVCIWGRNGMGWDGGYILTLLSYLGTTFFFNFAKTGGVDENCLFIIIICNGVIIDFDLYPPPPTPPPRPRPSVVVVLVIGLVFIIIIDVLSLFKSNFKMSMIMMVVPFLSLF